MASSFGIDLHSAIQLIHEDNALLVLNKPSGMLCVPGKGADKQDCLSARVLAQYPDALVVHRLDMATSGLVLMARGLRNQRVLNDAFASRRVGKRYTAVVSGNLMQPDDEWGLIDLPIMADWPNRPLQRVDRESGKPSATRWRLAGSNSSAGDCCQADANGEAIADTTRLELEPLTGRTHQLRVHLAAIGHPILGDALYAPAAARQRAARLLLHASQLGFLHPATGQAMQFDNPAPF